MRVSAILLALLVAVPALAQDRPATERRLAALRAQIRGAEQTVQRARADETSALQAVEGLASEIRLREELVSGYRAEIDSVRTETVVLERSIERLDQEIELTQQSVRDRARHAYMHGRRNALALILSAGSLNQMIVRARYLQQFAAQRRRQAERIAAQTDELRAREALVRERMQTSQRLLMQTTAEQQTLALRRREREALASDLRGRRAGLERQLAQQRADASALERLVRDLGVAERQRAEAARAAARAEAARAEAARAEVARVEAERTAALQRRADEAARRAAEREVRARPEPRPEPRPVPPAAPPVAAARPAPRPEPAARPEARPEPAARPAPRPAAPVVRAAPPAEAPALRPAPRAAVPEVLGSGSFASFRGRLPWPAEGTVTGRFGTRTDPVYNTQVQAIGVDLATAPGAPARAVFEGTVERVGAMATYGTFVMVSHGDFTTIYGNLSGVAVERGQRVTAGQAVGRAGTAEARRGSQLFFALFQSGRPVDPLAWLQPR